MPLQTETQGYPTLNSYRSHEALIMASSFNDLVQPKIQQQQVKSEYHQKDEEDSFESLGSVNSEHDDRLSHNVPKH
jgi:hypothetical protein